MTEPTYQIEVEFEDGLRLFKNVVYDGVHPEKPFFYSFVFEDRTKKEYPLDRIRGLSYGTDKADHMDYWREHDRNNLAG